jgi:hypothetical protein
MRVEKIRATRGLTRENSLSDSSINIVSTADGPVALMSNFAYTPFMLDGLECASVEGFIQGLKCENPDKQARICARHGYEAKRAGTRERNRHVLQTQTVWWRGKPPATTVGRFGVRGRCHSSDRTRREGA